MLKSKTVQVALSLLFFPFGLYFLYCHHGRLKWIYMLTIVSVVINVISFHYVFIKPINTYVLLSVLWANILTAISLAVRIIPRKLWTGRWNFYHIALLTLTTLILYLAAALGCYLSRGKGFFVEFFIVSMVTYMATLLVYEGKAPRRKCQ